MYVCNSNTFTESHTTFTTYAHILFEVAKWSLFVPAGKVEKTITTSPPSQDDAITISTM